MTGIYLDLYILYKLYDTTSLIELNLICKMFCDFMYRNKIWAHANEWTGIKLNAYMHHSSNCLGIKQEHHKRLHALRRWWARWQRRSQNLDWTYSCLIQKNITVIQILCGECPHIYTLIILILLHHLFKSGCLYTCGKVQTIYMLDFKWKMQKISGKIITLQPNVNKCNNIYQNNVIYSMHCSKT